MKNKIILFMFILFIGFSFGCNTKEHGMYIESNDEVVIFESIKLNAFLNNQKLSSKKVQWTLSDYNIASIENGVLYAKDYGTVVVGVYDDETGSYCTKSIEIIPPFVIDIEVIGENEVLIDKTITLEANVIPSIITSEIIWESSNEDIILVDNGEVYANGIGVADIILKCEEFEKRFTITVLPMPTTIEVEGDPSILVNQVANLKFNIEDEVVLTSSNPEIVQVVGNTILGVKEGKAVINAHKKDNPEMKGTFEVTVTDLRYTVDMTEEERVQIEEILSKMSLEQMIGQMFNIGFNRSTERWSDPVQIENATGLPFAQFSRNDPQTSVIDYISNYPFGNFTIEAASGDNRNNLIKAINTLYTTGKSKSGVNPLITLEYSGGKTMNGIIGIPANKALSTASSETIYETSNLFASQLKALGINSVINTYPNMLDNSEIVTFGKDIPTAIVASGLMGQAYSNNDVVLIPDLSIMYSYSDARPFDQLKQEDYKLIDAAIQNGAQIISLPLSAYTDISKNYAFLEEKIVKEYLRQQLCFDGVLMLDDSVLQTLVYDDYLESYIIQAVNLGVDMFSFEIEFTISRWSDNEYIADRLLGLYSTILNAVNNGQIEQQKIKESVTRILLVKLRNGVLEERKESSFDYNKLMDDLSKYTTQFITVYGENYKLSEDENILFISDRYDVTSTPNSLGDNARSYFELRGYNNVQIYHKNTLYPQTIIEEANKYNKIFVTVSSFNDSTSIGFAASAMNFVEFLKQINNSTAEVIMIYTGNEEYTEKLNFIDDHILLYGYYESNFESLFRVLNQEAQPNKK